MKRLWIGVSAAVMLAACGKSDEGSSGGSSDGGGSGSPPGSASIDPAKPWEDNSKPYLSDKKMGDFIASLKDDKSPFDVVSKGDTSAFNAGAKMNEFDAAARKHGFASGEEYMGAWMRINAASIHVMLDAQNQQMIKDHEASIQAAKEGLKRPDLTPEMKQMYESQIAGSQESLKALKEPRETSVPQGDLDTFKKHKATFEEAMKKWTK